MTNLLHETLGVMHENGKNSEDVLWVGSADGKLAITWPEFEAIANFEYDDGFGSQKIGSDLVVVGRSGWWMERHEYDGSEWWEFKQKPVRAPQARKFNKVTGGMWRTLEEQNSLNVDMED